MPVWFGVAFFFAIGTSFGLVFAEPLWGSRGAFAAIIVGAVLGALAAWLAFAIAIPLWQAWSQRPIRR